VSRTNFISSSTTKTVRIIGLSTALANAKDLANWLGIEQVCDFSVNIISLARFLDVGCPLHRGYIKYETML